MDGRGPAPYNRLAVSEGPKSRMRFTVFAALSALALLALPLGGVRAQDETPKPADASAGLPRRPIP